MPLFVASHLGLVYGSVEVFSDVDAEATDGARIGIVGPNGGGKTSLLRIIVGELEPSAGIARLARGVRIGYVPQSPNPTAAGSLRDEIMTAFEGLHRLEAALEAVSQEIERMEGGAQLRALERQASLSARYEALGGYSYRSTMERVCAGVGLSHETLATLALSASGGERTRAALARALLYNPDLLVLDEPTNHLDLKGLTWLEKFLGHYSHAFVVASHDRYFLDRVVTQVWELDHGRLQVFRGSYTAYRAQKAEQVLRQQREHEKQQEHIAREEAFIQKYHAGQRAREARGRATRLQALERVEAPRQEAAISMTQVSASRTGQVVVSTRELKVGFIKAGAPVSLLSTPDLKLERGSRTAIIGDNGTGKTSLLETLLGLTPPIEGNVSLGHNVKPGYYRQGLDDLPEDSTVLEALLDVKDMPPGGARSYLAKFLFTGDDVFQQVSSLSGGERSRLAIARLLLTEPNFLVLDEPTNHLDIPSCEALEQVLLSYNGTLLFVSHDRQLISRLAGQLWIVGDGTVRPFAGNFEEWMRTLQEAAPAQPQPKKPRPSQPPRPPAPRKKPTGPPPENPEQVIDRLEEKLRGIESQLEAASTSQDVDAIARLGQEHIDVQAQLDQKLEEWLG